MIASEYEYFCDSNLSLRRIEISTLLKFLQMQNLSPKEQEVLIKNFIVFLYSNWQGYIDECSKKYLEFVNVQCSKWICILETDFYTWNLKIDTLKRDYFKRLKIDYADFITKCIKELRFNLLDIAKINGWTSTDFSNQNNFQQTLSYIVNNGLVDLRNNISHGKKVSLYWISEIEIIVEFIFKILEKYKEFLIINIYNETYLTPSTHSL